MHFFIFLVANGFRFSFETRIFFAKLTLRYGHDATRRKEKHFALARATVCSYVDVWPSVESLKRQSRLQQTTFKNTFSFFFRENKT